jgi:hypothetical protein
MLGLDRVQSGADATLGRSRSHAALPPFRRHGRSGIPRPAVSLAAGPESKGPSPGTTSARPGTGTTPSASPAWTGPPLLPRPATAAPLTVLSVGDSIGIDLGQALARLLEAKGNFVTRIDGREASGLARPDYFDWPYQIASDMGAVHPDVVVAMFGANDAQGFIVNGQGILFGTPEWRQIYRERVAQVMEEVTGSGRPLVWVGMPVMGSPTLSAGLRVINGIVSSEARAHRGVIYVDSWRAFTNGDGRYSPYLPNASGHLELAREQDGVHLTAAGGDLLAADVYRALRTFWNPA